MLINLKNFIALLAFPLLLFQEKRPASVVSIRAHDDPTWNGKKAAVVLTYDDGLNVHLDNAIPLLDSLNLKATFYVSNYPDALNRRMNDWRKAAGNGHELGNHTIMHPCLGNIPGREWVQPEYDMSKYSPARMADEIRTANMLLRAIDGKTGRSFAYTCGDKTINGVDYLAPFKKEFSCARGVNQGMHTKNDIDLFDVKCYSTNGQTAEEVISWVKEAQANNKLLVFLFHGIGGEHSLNLSLDAHRKLLRYLKDNEKDIWVATMDEVARYVADL